MPSLAQLRCRGHVIRRERPRAPRAARTRGGGSQAGGSDHVQAYCGHLACTHSPHSMCTCWRLPRADISFSLFRRASLRVPQAAPRCQARCDPRSALICAPVWPMDGSCLHLSLEPLTLQLSSRKDHCNCYKSAAALERCTSQCVGHFRCHLYDTSAVAIRVSCQQKQAQHIQRSTLFSLSAGPSSCCGRPCAH